MSYPLTRVQLYLKKTQRSEKINTPGVYSFCLAVHHDEILQKPWPAPAVPLPTYLPTYLPTLLMGN